MKKQLLTVCMLLSLLAGCAKAPPSSESSTAETTLPFVTLFQNPDYYAVCTEFSKFEVEQFARDVRVLILDSDWEALSGCISYPITLGGITYGDAAAFAGAPFETQLNADALEAIRSEDCTDLFCNYQGIMLGNGEVWIAEVVNEDGTSAGLRVIALHILSPSHSIPQ